MFPSPSNRSIRYSDIDDIPVLKNCFRLLQIGVLGILEMEMMFQEEDCFRLLQIGVLGIP